MPDAVVPAADGARLRPLLDWIVTEGRLEPDLGRFVDGLMKHAVAAGLPIWRFYIGLQLVHPQMVATGVLWRRDSGYEEVPRLHGILTSSAYLLVAIPLEERSLRHSSSGAYDHYMREVRWKLLPGVF